MEHSPSIQTDSSSSSQKIPLQYSKQPSKFEALDNILNHSDFMVRGIYLVWVYPLLAVRYCFFTSTHQDAVCIYNLRTRHTVATMRPHNIDNRRFECSSG